MGVKNHSVFTWIRFIITFAPSFVVHSNCPRCFQIYDLAFSHNSHSTAHISRMSNLGLLNLFHKGDSRKCKTCFLIPFLSVSFHISIKRKFIIDLFGLDCIFHSMAESYSGCQSYFGSKVHKSLKCNF